MPEVSGVYYLGYLQYNFCIKFCSLNHSFIMVRYTGYRYKDTVKRRLTITAVVWHQELFKFYSLNLEG